MKFKTAELNVPLTDVITPISCVRLVNDLVKYLAFHKQLIPYHYDRLELCVHKHQESLNNSCITKSTNNAPKRSKLSLDLEKSFKTIKEAYDSFENIFTLIKEEINDDSYNRVDEVVILLGPTVFNPQDVLRVQIPPLNFLHSAKYHSSRKNHGCLFRSIVESEQFHDFLSHNSCRSNLFVFLKMKPNVSARSSVFIPRHDFKLPTRGHHAVISFKPSSETEFSCSCLGIEVYEDKNSPHVRRGSSPLLFPTTACSTPRTSLEFPNLDGTTLVEEKSKSKWYQVKCPVKAFPDVKINGISVTDIWVNPNLVVDH